MRTLKLTISYDGTGYSGFQRLTNRKGIQNIIEAKLSHLLKEPVQVAGSGALRRHLLDMGLTPGVRVRLIGTALLGAPLILLVRGSRVSIRRRLARQIILSGGEAE